jgi:hypothetical protein
MRPALRSLLLGLAALTRHAAPVAAEVTQFSPEGTVKRVRQVSALFSKAMAPFGDPRAADSFDIACSSSR